jgi:3' terminal RNA ribose 2'-O-methyltransferase Hen1
MLLTITTTHTPATDLGFLLHKHPARIQTFDLSFGQAHVFYPEATAERCTAALLLDIDPIQLFRRRRGTTGSGFALDQYVNDRPYVASSFLSVAIAQVFGTALAGHCKNRPDLVDLEMPLTARISAISSRNGEELLYRLFSPLGYKTRIESHVLDKKFPEWGMSNVFGLQIEALTSLKQLLTHLYVLIPVLDDDKHYYVGEEEIAKLMARGEGWLSGHPERELIVDRYLRHQRKLTETALARLREDEIDKDEQGDEPVLNKEYAVEKSTGLHQKRLEAVLAVLKNSGVKRVVDLGCGEGKLIGMLLPDAQFTEIVGMDVSTRSLSLAEKHLQLDRLPESIRNKLKLIQGSLLYRDTRIEGYDAALLVEVIEHLEPTRLHVLEKVVFGKMRTETVIVTTPNREYNHLWPKLPADKFRHSDHHFEWDRAEFQSWVEHVTSDYGFQVAVQPIGPFDPQSGPPTQMAVFKRARVA